jgi:hypothetical protein
LKLIKRCQLAPDTRTDPLLLEANELTAMLTAGMKRLRPVTPPVLASLAVGLVRVLSSQFSVLSSQFSVLSSKF